ncbi:MAG TPA: glycerol-3-phosphate 1-O-acyltransferase PlsY [Armatimonadota bacterium]|jgi:glycerol-3-phosphate acyltransferase PlsY
MQDIGLILFGYLLGAIPFGYLVGKFWKGVDITKIGSGNIGTTNTFRVLGPGPAAAVFVLDVSKGFVPIFFAQKLSPASPWLHVVVALITILGHTLSVFLKFKGGKGVATSLGAIIGLNPLVAAIAFGLWVLFTAVTRYVSVASLVAAVSIPVMMFAFGLNAPYKIFAIVAATYVIYKHRSNVDRLLHGTEPRFGQKVKVEEE